MMALAAAYGCSRSEDSAPETGAVELRFGSGGISVEAAPAGATKASAENLAAGTTVRVVAYSRSGADADLSQDSYAAEATYLVQADGSLTPCSVDASGASTGTAGASHMYLRSGTYDFYALTPALPLSDNKQVSVGHGVDYACSLTPARTVGGTHGRNVALAMLLRRCSRLCFSVTRRAEHIASAEIVSVGLFRIAQAPATALLCEALPVGAGTGAYSFPNGTFMPGPELYQSYGADETLPKGSAAFDLAMEVRFNGAASPTALEAEVPTMAFAPGLRYNFDVSLEGKYIVLTLTVAPWNEAPAWDLPDIGESPLVGVEVGRWEITEWGTDIGGYFTPVLKPGSWVANGDWTTDLGAYFEALAEIYPWMEKVWGTEFASAPVTADVPAGAGTEI